MRMDDALDALSCREPTGSAQERNVAVLRLAGACELMNQMLEDCGVDLALTGDYQLSAKVTVARGDHDRAVEFHDVLQARGGRLMVGDTGHA